MDPPTLISGCLCDRGELGPGIVLFLDWDKAAGCGLRIQLSNAKDIRTSPRSHGTQFVWKRRTSQLAVAALMIVQVVASCRFVDFIRLWWSWLLTSDLRLSWWGRGRSAAPIWNHDKARQHCQSSANECALDFNVENRFTSRVQSYCARTPGNHKVLCIHTWCRISSINTLKFGSWVIFFPDSIL